MIMTQTLMTPREQERAKRDAAIKTDYGKMKAQYEKASDWRICTALAQKYRLTPTQIRNITR